MSDKLLILDMDDCILHTESFNSIDQLDGGYDFKFPLGNVDDQRWYFTVKRPFLDQFMDYAFKNFKVAIWTAGGSDYAKENISRCGIDESKLEFLWTRERCTIKYDLESLSHYGEKNLSKVKRLGWDLEKIIIVDDVPKTASNNYGNLIRIKQFYNDRNDTELLKLMNYLESIKDAEDIRSIEKRGWSNKD